MRQRQLRRLLCYAASALAVCLLLYTKSTELFENEKRTSTIKWNNPTSAKLPAVTKQNKSTTLSRTTTKNLRYPLRPGCTDFSQSLRQKDRKLGNILADFTGNNGKSRRFIRTGSSFSLNLRRKPTLFAEDLDVFDDWWKAFTELSNDLDAVKKDYSCPGMKSRGNWWDCNSRQFVVRQPCLIYSFGIDNDFRFDDAMAELDCEVHSFDPSMEMKEHERENGVHFHSIGIGSYNNDSFHPVVNEYTLKVPNKTWKMRTLASIMSSLGHTNRTLDILKLDIEGYEWQVLENIICENLTPKIKQLNIEFHIFPNFPPRDEYVKILQVYQTLWNLDFKRYHTLIHQLHRNKDKTHLQADVAFVNINYNTDLEIDG